MLHVLCHCCDAIKGLYFHKDFQCLHIFFSYITLTWTSFPHSLRTALIPSRRTFVHGLFIVDCSDSSCSLWICLPGCSLRHASLSVLHYLLHGCSSSPVYCMVGSLCILSSCFLYILRQFQNEMYNEWFYKCVQFFFPQNRLMKHCQIYVMLIIVRIMAVWKWNVRWR